MPAFGNIKSGDSLFCISSPPLPPHCKYQWPTPSPLINTNWPSLQHGCDLYKVLREVYVQVIKIHFNLWSYWWNINLCQWWSTCKNAPETLLLSMKKKTQILRKMGQIRKLKYRKAHKSILCGKFGMVTHTGNQELSNLSRRCLDKFRRVDISLFVDFLAF